MNVGKSKVVRCSRYVNGGRMHVRLNGDPLEKVDCFKRLRSHVATVGGCVMGNKMIEGYKAWGALKSKLYY